MKSSPSILSVLYKLRELLTRKEKIKCIGIVGFAISSSLLETATAVTIVSFAQALSYPQMGKKFLCVLGFDPALTTERVLFYLAMIFGGVYLLKNLVYAIEIFYHNVVTQEMNYNFKNKLLTKFQEKDYIEMVQKNSAYSLQVIQSDVDRTFSVGVMAISSSITEIFTCILLSFLIFYKNFLLALLVLFILFFVFLIFYRFLVPKFYCWGQEIQKAALGANKNLLELKNGFKEIVLINKVAYFVNKYAYFSAIKKKIHIYEATATSLPRVLVESIYVLVFMFAVWFIIIKNHNHNIADISSVLALYLYVGFRLIPGITRIINHVNSLISTIPCIERVHAEFTAPTSLHKHKDFPNFHFNNMLSIDNVSFQHTSANRYALKNISLQIKRGDNIGIAGETGSGKSTFIDLILGILIPCEGHITIDQKYPVNCKQWHQKIGYVPQVIYLIDDTIEANIAFGEELEEIDQEKLNKAIDEAQLRSFIDKLPDGVKTNVGERGVLMSGGERQRVAIARALYRNPEILIFDEATSALDNETEKRLMAVIDGLKKNRTVIMVAHRLTTLKECDKIIILKQGVIDRVTSYVHL
jgi:ABC-type multidrug transport system fused ATPase/permease subunit